MKQQKCYNRSSVGFRFTSGVVPQKKEEEEEEYVLDIFRT